MSEYGTAPTNLIESIRAYFSFRTSPKSPAPTNIKISFGYFFMCSHQALNK